MPTYETPEPIGVVVELTSGEVLVAAGSGQRTTVTVRPSDPSHDADVRAADLVRVEYDAGRLLVKSPRQRGIGLFARPGSVDVSLSVPAGSHLEGEGQLTRFRSTGRLGACRVRTQAGDVVLEHTGAVEASTHSGAVTVDRVEGDIRVSTSHGGVRLGTVAGAAVVKNSNGETWIGDVDGDLRVSAGNGDVVVDRVGGSLSARSGNGDVRIGSLARGSASVQTGKGEIHLGVPRGTAARLDVHTGFGRVRNGLEAADGPGSGDQVVQVRALTGYGDIVIGRG